MTADRTPASRILPTANECWGFWGTARRNGLSAPMAWEAVSDALSTAFDLTAIQTRDLLDAPFGRHMADDLSFIKEYPVVSPAAIKAHVRQRLANASWRRWVEAQLRRIKAV